MTPLVIIPTYNERENLPRLVAEIRRVVADATILVVDDNSPDGTGDVADGLRRTDPRVFVLHRPVKQGLGRAYRAGFRWALERKFDPICTMDADGSHDPAELPKLLAATAAGAGIGLGSRYAPGGTITGWTWDRHLLSSGANWLTRLLLSLGPRDVTAGYKCYRRSFLARLPIERLVSPGYAFQVEMVAHAKQQGETVTEVPITFRDRTRGRSKMSRHELLGSARSLLLLASQRRGVRQMIKFGLVGTANFAIDIGVTNLLVLLAQWQPIPAGGVGTTIALFSSFLMHRRWTFLASGGAVMTQASRFLLINGSGAVVNLLIYSLLITLFGIWYNFAKILAIGGSGLWNFLGTKYWVFRAGPPLKSVQSPPTTKAPGATK